VKVIIVGAGIAGLAAAWELTRAAGADVSILESERRAGGVIISERVQGFLIEAGPDGFLAGERDLPALAEELGIGDHVVGQQTRGTMLWTGKALAPIDEGKAAALLGIEAKKDDVEGGFRTFAGGMAEPVTALEQRLASLLRFAQGVAGLTPNGSSGWRLAITGGSAHDADAVILAVPAYRAGRILEAVGVTGARALEDVVYLPSLTVSLAYRESQFTRPLQGAGFVASPETAGAVRACTFASRKFPGRAPAGHVLLRAFLAPQDGDAPATAHAELAAILGIEGQPLWSRVFQWARGLPRYPTDHRALVADVRHRLERLPPLAITGAGYDGAGVSACVRSGREAGRLIARRLSR